MLGDVGLRVHRRGESKEFGFKNAILPTGIGHIELELRQREHYG